MSAESEGKARAEEFRREHDLGHQPLEDLVALIDLTVGLDVAILDAERDEHGMAMQDPERGVTIIAVARTRHPMRQRSTLAHELGHVLFGDYARPKPDQWDERSHEECRADAFARHLLVPLNGVRSFSHDGPAVLADLSRLVQRFQASPQMVAIQLREGRRISQAQVRSWASITTPQLAAQFGWSDQYHALQRESDARRAPQRLLARATTGYLANVISLSAIARLRGITPHEVESEFEEAGLIPHEADIEWASPDDLPPVNDDLDDLDDVLPPPAESGGGDQYE